MAESTLVLVTLLVVAIALVIASIRLIIHYESSLIDSLLASTLTFTALCIIILGIMQFSVLIE